MSSLKKHCGPEWLLKPWERIDSPIGIFYVRKNLHDQIAVLVQCILIPLSSKRLHGFVTGFEEEHIEEEFIPEPQYTWLLIDVPDRIKRKLHTTTEPKQFDNIEQAKEDADERLIRLGLTLLTEKQAVFV